MGGSVKKGYTIVGGVVCEEVKKYYDQLVKEKKFESRSQAIGHVLTKYMEKNSKKEEKTITSEDIEKIFLGTNS